MSTATNTLHRPESRRQKFLRLGNKRLDSALDEIRLIENLLQNPYTYEYDSADVEIIVAKLAKATERLKHFQRETSAERAKAH